MVSPDWKSFSGSIRRMFLGSVSSSILLRAFSHMHEIDSSASTQGSIGSKACIGLTGTDMKASSFSLLYYSVSKCARLRYDLNLLIFFRVEVLSIHIEMS